MDSDNKLRKYFSVEAPKMIGDIIEVVVTPWFLFIEVVSRAQARRLQ